MQEFNLPGPLLDELLLELTQGTDTLYFAQNQKDYSIEELIKNITSKGDHPGWVGIFPPSSDWETF